jgi:stage II sporulation protein AB (anti-sigma F factor)
MRENKIQITFPAITENERMARMIAAVFLTEMDPTMEELDDVKTAVSEAVTNSILHAYEEEKEKMTCKVQVCYIRRDMEMEVIVEDFGKGIENVKQAMEPLFTTKPKEERSGMGFSFMEAFMDELSVTSVLGQGTKVVMKKRIGSREE